MRPGAKPRLRERNELGFSWYSKVSNPDGGGTSGQTSLYQGGADQEEDRVKKTVDRVNTTGSAWLGLTVACAQCHSHKYDPLTQDEYYRVFAFLNDTHEADIAAYTPDEQQRRAEVYRAIREVEDDLKHRTPDWPARLADWETAWASIGPRWSRHRK